MSIPKNLCILPFMHLASKPNGYARYCCAAYTHYVRDDQNNIMTLDQDIHKIWNSEHAKQFRKQFLNNEMPEVCKNCWTEEANGKISKRIRSLERHLENHVHSLKYALANNYECELPTYLDLRLGNTCNLKCRICNNVSSSLIADEITQWDDNFFAKPRPLNKNYNAWYTTNSFIDNIKKLLPNLQHIYTTGGEPTVIPEVSSFMQECIQTSHNHHIRFVFNTNLAVHNRSFYSLVTQFAEWEAWPSIDAIDEQITYLRHPVKWSTVSNNLQKLINTSVNPIININCTVSAYNIFYLEKIFNRLTSFSTDRVRVNVMFNIAHTPEYINFNILTASLKNKIIKKINNFLSNNTELNINQKADVICILNLLPITPVDIITRQKEFSKYNQYLDSIRNENFAEVFPELVEMLQF